MSDCSEIREMLVLEVERELDPGQSAMVREHLRECEACAREAGGIREVRELLLDPSLFAPVEDESWGTFAERCASKSHPLDRTALVHVRKKVPSGGWNLNRSALRWALPMAACLLLGVGLVWMLRQPETPVQTVSVAAPGNEAFLEKMNRQLATSATSRYLAECQDLLVALLKADQTCRGKGYDMSQEITRARELLQTRRILESELSAPEVARAKDLCDDLENLLVSVSLSRDCESPDKFRWMEGMIEKERLLLRIRLMQSEIS
jgi:hypothetical protein